MDKKVGVGLVGSRQFISTIHAEALKLVPDAALVAVASHRRQCPDIRPTTRVSPELLYRCTSNAGLESIDDSHHAPM
ncbi:MAG: hypothetical protein IPK76_21985 [Lewinellaceae bacterium]|nr:hypothetical protein [Lewinellaceae bacterium]